MEEAKTININLIGPGSMKFLINKEGIIDINTTGIILKNTFRTYCLIDKLTNELTIFKVGRSKSREIEILT